MNKLSQWMNTVKEKIKGLSKKKKIAYGAILAGILGAFIYLGISLGSTKYGVLFSNIDKNDMGAVYNKLKEKKESFKVDGNAILVPKEKVDSLRMEILSEVPMTNGSQGFELLDKSKFGATDAEMKINYQRALQGELERTIKGFPEIDNVRVHLVLPEDSAFVKDTTPAKASITLKLKPYKKLTEEQVKAIVTLVSGSVKNLPKENVEVNDTNGDLTKDLFDKDKMDMTGAAEKQQALKKEYEKNLENKVLNMLQAVYGKDKVKVKVNADLNFDAIEKSNVIYDPKNVVVSEKSVKDTTKDGANGASGSPVDDAMGNRIGANADGSTTTHEENTKNYEISKSEDKTIKAPGDVERLTVSVILDGTLDNATRSSVTNAVSSAVGFDQRRGDTISVEGLTFDTSNQDKINKDLEEMKKEEERLKRNKLYTIIGAAVAIALIALIIFLIKRKKRNEELDELEPQGIDVVIDDEVPVEEKPKFKPIELDVEDEKSHVEKEIRKYASDKPDQVAEIIKSWLAEDER
ncbi:flagellar M-ring protein FliF [Clostridium tetanomorphum]|uniref:Flagellar M-ring protein n=1 Tax=Clostridium tetanomorphum TaxID=1553 RepID=A0A923IYS8_CLOTT|nr:flagellar basal-body MS-ring/collar protein FliF [Clostridium tetanomorphum]KAJ49909.1 flagellar MS-ring protein [Clostridium tetanomorphum DSM 665]MBC2396686.1 flagellar M-ring protein FliF [Clostridium tetanomorphum]MBP1866153.1 flagellar M-ring protein FliF [Clostridium tetanomorphum]NRS85132.1 flagellar M-ring protein FliF [Clostridium tetanomorphum]NRZ98313.1 flagellar M-ring protein FliF [Clostridium tetanomorphum]